MRVRQPGEFGAWFDACGAGLVLYARQWLDAAQAEDAVQDVFVRLLGQRWPPENVKAWLFRSVRNAAIGELRKQSRRRRREQRVAADRPEWFEGRGDDLIDGRSAQEALAALPADQREIVVLRIWAGLTLREVGQVVGLPVSTVFGRYHAALAAIREEMVRSCETRKD